MTNFFLKRYYREKRLSVPADIVQYSYIVQDSICYLDLEISKFSTFPNYSTNNSTDTVSRGVISTEEKCRKTLEKSRYLLYNLHLDLAKGKEWNLKECLQNENLWFNSSFPLMSRICIAEEFYDNLLYRLIEYAVKYTNHKIRVLKWFLKHFATKTLFEVPAYIINYFVECMHPGFNDSEFANDCFRKLNFRNWMLFFERPDGVGNLLYQIHLLGRKREHIRWSYFFIERCLVHPSLLYVNDVLKFSDALSFRSNIHNYLLRRVLRNFRSWSRQQFSRNLREKRRMSWRTRQRTSLLLQLFWIHQNIFETNTAASEALRLVWNSVPDAHLSSEEINDIFKNILNSNEIVNLYKFYSEAVCEFHAVVEPRSLKHYCRISIRKSLCRNKQWIPEGVQRIGLPVKLQSFLKLEY
ncbi:uncharacterized protein LOC129988814 [Argiope bruennichi]|uniref:uncharacterized protein LOC129988814 n=1 Tax=Argiope bruennichi TaxID=94029 RepID=UPI0024950CA1|nr:uncharacterized protein LOC129988814 [Argiope bruennichi]